MRNDRYKNILMVLLFAIGMIILVIFHAWKISELGGFRIFSEQTWEEMKIYLIVSVIFVAGKLIWNFVKDKEP